MKRSAQGAIVLVWTWLVLPGMVKAEDPAKTREFEFTYQVKLTGLPAGQTYRLWLPIPPSNEFQTVHLVKRTNLNVGKVTTERKNGNQMLYIEGLPDQRGEADAEQVFSVVRREVTTPGPVPSAEEIDRFLQADQLVPVGGKSLTLLEGKQLPMNRMELGRVLYDTVNSHMKYSKEGSGWGRGDSNWACDSRFGNCSDFHSMFISLARAQRMPAKFEIGFPLPEKRGSGDIPGYHCWAFFQPDAGRGWIPVDISEANKQPALSDYYFGHLTENRIAFSTGRNLTLEPPQAGPPLNFFVYPYAEVNGKAWPAEKISKSFKYRDRAMN